MNVVRKPEKWRQAAAKLDAAIEADRTAQGSLASGRLTVSSPSAKSVSEDAVVLERADKIPPQAVSWIWEGWLARGKLHILAGPPGEGKTTIALDAMATITGGGRWPDGSPCERGDVLIWSGEDDPADTLVPRLTAMGANLERVHFVRGMTIGGKPEPFDPARDMVALAAQAAEVGNVRLLVVDPIVSAVAADSHKNGEVRRSLQPVVDLAAALGCAVLGISHFSKGTAGRDPVERVTGSLAFGALPRVVLCSVKVKVDTSDGGGDRRILARAKSNIGPDGGGFEYRIDQVELPGYPGVRASRVTWGVAVDGSAHELLAVAEAEPADAHSDIAGFLRGLLHSGPMPAKAILQEAADAGFSRDQVQRAARQLGVTRSKLGMTGGWVWALPAGKRGTEGSEGGTQQRLPSSPSSPSSEPSSGPHGDEERI